MGSDPPDDRASGPSRAGRQVHAVLAWLVVEADVTDVVHLHLLDALVAWSPLLGEHLFPTEPEAGVDADLRHVLDELWCRLDAQAAEAPWEDKVVLNKVRGRVGLGGRRCVVADAEPEAARLVAAARWLAQDGQQRYAEVYSAATAGGWAAGDLTALGFAPSSTKSQQGGAGGRVHSTDRHPACATQAGAGRLMTRVRETKAHITTCPTFRTRAPGKIASLSHEPSLSRRRVVARPAQRRG